MLMLQAGFFQLAILAVAALKLGAARVLGIDFGNSELAFLASLMNDHLGPGSKTLR